MSNPQMSVFANNDAHFIIDRDPRSPGPAVLYLDMSDSSPIQGRFEIDSSGEAALRNLEPHARARLGTLFLELEAAGNRPSSITVELIDKAKARTPTPVVERAERLPRFPHDETSQIGETLEYQHGDPRPRLYSESTSPPPPNAGTPRACAKAGEVQFLPISERDSLFGFDR